MTAHACPNETVLARFVDRDLAPEDAQRLAAHVASCPRCGALHAELAALRAELAAPLVRELDVHAHVAEVMQRLEQPRALRVRRWPLLAAAFSALALCVFVAREFEAAHAGGGFVARGGGTAPAIARDVGVQPYADRGGLVALAPGDTIAPETPLTAGYRNLGPRSVYLLLFAVDARSNVHWIAPAYTEAARDPLAQELPASAAERMLPTTAVFDDLAPGPLRIVSVLSPQPLRVSAIETLSATELEPRAITRRLPQVEVRESRLEVRAPEGAP